MGFILLIHLTACVLLVITILMQSGRGGGLTETFQSAESMFGTQTNVFMVRLTSVLAVIFLCTSLVLAMHSSKVNNSLMANKKLLSVVPPVKEESAKPDNETQVKVEAPKAVTTAAVAAPAAKAAADSTASKAQEAPVNSVTNAAK